MKIKIWIASIVGIILVLCAFFLWKTYLKPVDVSTFSGFKTTLKCKGYIVKYASGYSELNSFTVDGGLFLTETCDSKTIDSSIEKIKSNMTNSQADYFSTPHLYNKGFLIVTYIGDNKKLLKTLDDMLGRSLVN